MIRLKSVLILILFIIVIILLSSIKHDPKLIIPRDEKYFNETLQRLLIPRWSQSDGHANIGEYITGELDQCGYSVLLGELSDPYPITNVIGISNLRAKRFILLSCHYDSKYLESIEFYVAATDAGVSCAILLNMAKSLSKLKDLDLFKRVDIGLMLAFFDGHESVEGINDGSHPLLGSQHFVKTEIIPIKSINLVITLNLIGAPDHIYMSKYERTYNFHEQMANIEQELKDSGELYECHQLFYKLKSHESDMEDDHYPFLEKGIPAMHIIPHTYPEVWMQETDNIDNLHWPSIGNMNSILTRFAYEYFKHYVKSAQK